MGPIPTADYKMKLIALLLPLALASYPDIAGSCRRYKANESLKGGNIAPLAGHLAGKLGVRDPQAPKGPRPGKGR